MSSFRHRRAAVDTIVSGGFRVTDNPGTNHYLLLVPIPESPRLLHEFLKRRRPGCTTMSPIFAASRT